jgi:hypothetical protein
MCFVRILEQATIIIILISLYLIEFFNRDGVCLLRGTDCTFIRNWYSCSKGSRIQLLYVHEYQYVHEKKISFIHSVFCLTTGPKPLPQRAFHTVRSRASSFKWQYLTTPPPWTWWLDFMTELALLQNSVTDFIKLNGINIRNTRRL